jgi:hypothetical protein
MITARARAAHFPDGCGKEKKELGEPIPKLYFLSRISWPQQTISHISSQSQASSTETTSPHSSQ